MIKHIKCVVVGDNKNDKASLLVTYTRQTFPDDYIPTVFDDYSINIIFEDELVNLQLYDTAEQDYKKLRHITYPGTDVFACVFSLLSPKSLENIENMWIPEIKEHCPNTPYILVGVNSFLRDEFPKHISEFKEKGWEPVSTEKGEEMKRKIKASDYIECDYSKQIHLSDVFNAAIRAVLHPVPIEEEGANIKKKFRLFKNQKEKKSAKKDKEISKNSDKDDNEKKKKKKKDNLKDEEYNEKMKLAISLSQIYEVKNDSKKNLLKMSLPNNSHEIKSPNVLIEVCSLNCQEFIEENKDKDDFFIGEEDEKYHVFVETISHNDFSISNKIIDILNHRMMCKKILIPKDRIFDHMKNAIKEYEILHSIEHPCICKIYGINTCEIIHKDDEDIKTIALFLEYLEFDLKECLNKGMISNTVKVQIIIEIIHAMICIHKKKLIYRDLKIENVRLDSNFNSKIVDLGFVKINEQLFPDSSYSHRSMIKGLGSAVFIAPEILKDEEYNYKADVYSFGMILYFIFDGKIPKYSLKDKITQKDVPLPDPSSSISEFCIDLISRCLSFDVESRPTFIDILNEIRSNSYSLASDIDQSFVSLRDQQLEMDYE